MSKSCNRQTGWTLVELVVVMSIAALLTALAVPSFRDQFTRTRLTTHSSTLLSSLLLARSEAIKRNVRVALCKSADGRTCITSGAWEQGWLVFVDKNNDASRAEFEPIVMVVGPLSGAFKLVGNSSIANYVSYSPSGATQFTSGAFQAGTFTLCDGESSSGLARKIVINATGRARITQVGANVCA